MVRGLKSTLALIVVLGGLLGYIYFVDAKKPAAGTETKPKAVTVAADQIEEVQIKSAAGETTRVRKAGDKWTVVEPVSADADSSELSSLTSGLADLEIQRVVDENPGDLSPYGLNPPRVDVAYRVKGQNDFSHVLLGEKTPTGGDLYAKRPDEKRVFLVASYLDNTFNRTSFDLRDKSVLKIESDKVDGLEISQGTQTVQFAKAGSTEWKIVKPVAARGEYGSIESLVGRLAGARMQKVVEADATRLKQYGLDRPAARATVSMGSAKATLIVGKIENEAAYAMDASKPMIFTIDKSLAEELNKGVSEYRRKDVFEFRPFTATQVKITRGAETFGVEKSSDKDGKEVWRNAAAKVVDNAKVEDVLNKLSSLRAQSFEAAANPSLKKPILTVTAKFNEENTETVNFGRAGSDVFAGRSDEPGSAKLEANSFDEAEKALEQLK